MTPGVTTNALSLAASLLFASGLSLLPMQLYNLWNQNDMARHAAVAAADALTKSMCSNSTDFGMTARGDLSGPRREYVDGKMRRSMALGDKCRALMTPSATTIPSTDFGSISMDVEVQCRLQCNILLFAVGRCDGEGSERYIDVSNTRVSVPMGCDAGEVW
jgi:hypothetical protein